MAEVGLASGYIFDLLIPFWGCRFLQSLAWEQTALRPVLSGFITNSLVGVGGALVESLQRVTR